MSRTFAVVSAVLVLLVGSILASCTGGTPAAAPTPSPSPWPTWTPTPLPTATPTRTPTPTVTPSPTPSAAVALLQEVYRAQEKMKSYRAKMSFDFSLAQRGVPQALTMVMDMEVAEPDASLKISSEGSPISFDVEMIVKDKVVYMKMGDEWTAMPGGGEFGEELEMGAMDVKKMQEFFAHTNSAKITGKRTVKGIECQVISFEIPPERMYDLLAMSGGAGQAPAPDDVQFEEFSGEVAVGLPDKLMHEMILRMSGSQRGSSADKFAMTIQMTIWDINSPGVVIKAPAGVVPPAVPPRPSATPARRS